MAYLAELGSIEVAATHKVTIIATLVEGDERNIEKFIKRENKKWINSIIESITFKEEDIVEVVLSVSEPNYFSEGTVFPLANASEGEVLPSSEMLRPIKDIEKQIKFYLISIRSKLRLDKIEIDKVDVEVKQILFPEDGKQYMIL